MKRIVSLLYAAVFFVICLVPSVGLSLTGGAKAGANEVLATKPSLTTREGTFNDGVLSDLADYIGDRFFLRQEAVTAWAELNASLLKTSVTEDVILGTDGWLYYAPTLADYTRSDPMDARELWCAARVLYLLQEYAEGRGGRFVFTVAPNKNSLYKSAMPEYPVSDGPSNAEALSVYLEQMGVHYLDLFEVFSAGDEILYFPTDSHWNGRGAALAADRILGALGRKSMFFSGTFSAAVHTGDLYEMLYPAGKDTDADYAYAPGFTFSANTSNPDNIRISADGPGTGSLLMYRDSFGRNLYAYLADSFARAQFSRRTDYDPTAMEDGGALVIELVERNLRYLNRYAPSLPAPERDPGTVGGAAARGEIPVLVSEVSEGLASITGTFGSISPDDDSPVYVSAGSAVYEAVPLPGGFAALLPGTDVTGISIVFRSSGELVSLTGTVE